MGSRAHPPALYSTDSPPRGALARAHPRAPRLVWIARRERRTVQRDAPRVRLVRTAEDLHQRALPRAILADERMHLAHADSQRNAPQRGRRAERFFNSVEGKAGRWDLGGGGGVGV